MGVIVPLIKQIYNAISLRKSYTTFKEIQTFGQPVLWLLEVLITKLYGIGLSSPFRPTFLFGGRKHLICPSHYQVADPTFFFFFFNKITMHFICVYFCFSQSPSFPCFF